MKKREANYCVTTEGTIIDDKMYSVGDVITLADEHVVALRNGGIGLVDIDDEDIVEHEVEDGYEYRDEHGKVIPSEDLDQYDLENADRVFNGQPEVMSE